MDRGALIHRIGDRTKTAVFRAPIVTSQVGDGWASITMHEEVGGPTVGHAAATEGGLVVLLGCAIDQYGPLAKPAQNTKTGTDRRGCDG